MIDALTQNPRILTFDGGCNFRDLGGYKTRDGRNLKWGRVFRTGVLSYFTENDQPHLNRLGIRAICDLRRAEEREREPTRWPDTNTQHLNWEDGDAPPTIRLLMANHPYTPAGMHAAMIDLYRALPMWMTPRLRDMFLRIAHGDVPILIHCAAGKDRTGIAIALLLEALDVPRDVIMDDYLLTNDATDMEEFILTRHEAQLGVALSKHPLLTIPEDIRKIIFAAHADYLQATFDLLARDYGTAAEFLRTEAGVDDELRSKVRRALLEPR